MSDNLSIEELERLFVPNFETGKLFWKELNPSDFKDRKKSATSQCNWWNSRYANKEAFTSYDVYGYKIGRIRGKGYKAHRVLFALYYGRWPEGDIDHINRDKADNSIKNIREATRAENMYNTKLRKDNTSGYKGVSLDKRKNKWMARIKINGKYKFLGYFNTPEQAHEAYCRAAELYHVDFFNDDYASLKRTLIQARKRINELEDELEVGEVLL